MKKISRKSFLKLAAATTAGAAMTPALMGCGWPSAQDLAPYQGDIVLFAEQRYPLQSGYF